MAGDRFDKFTERARKVLQYAQEEAQRFDHNYIGTEHLLLGLVREGEGVAAKVLANLGVELNKVRSAVESIVGRGDRAVTGDIGLTPQSKKVIELSVDEARRLGHHYIGTEHLLLGLVREGEGIAAGVLQSLGVSLDKVRSQVIYVLSQSQTYAAGMGARSVQMRNRTLWISAALLCAAPQMGDEAHEQWFPARGGPLHPVEPYISAGTFPHRATLALHVRVQVEDTGPALAGLLQVRIVDGLGTAVRWGNSGATLASLPIVFPKSSAAVTQLAQTLVLPLVVFPSAGGYALVVTLVAPSAGVLGRNEVRLPIEVVAPVRARRGAEAERDVTMTTLLRQLGPKLQPNAQRALRQAGAEARRLGQPLVQQEHLLIGLRRVLGKRSDLPAVQYLRDAAEQIGGLTLAAGGLGPYRVARGTATWLRAMAAASETPLNAAGLLPLLLADEEAGLGALLAAARRLAATPP